MNKIKTNLMHLDSRLLMGFSGYWKRLEVFGKKAEKFGDSLKVAQLKKLNRKKFEIFRTFLKSCELLKFTNLVKR